jgi:hypothetical protein
VVEATSVAVVVVVLAQRVLLVARVVLAVRERHRLLLVRPLLMRAAAVVHQGVQEVQAAAD